MHAKLQPSNLRDSETLSSTFAPDVYLPQATEHQWFSDQLIFLLTFIEKANLEVPQTVLFLQKEVTRLGRMDGET